MPDPLLLQQEQLVRSFVDQVINRRQVLLLPDFVSLDILEYSPFILLGAHEGRDFAQDIRRVLTAFDDLHMAITGLVNAPGRVAVGLDLSGRNTGPLPWTLQPTRRHAAWSAMAMLHIEDGRIGAIRGIADRHSMLHQLGLASPGIAPPQAGA